MVAWIECAEWPASTDSRKVNGLLSVGEDGKDSLV
jgi:hypothetical protein